MTIHSTASVDSRARLAENVTIGPGCIVGPNVELGAGTVLHAYAVLVGSVKLGEANQVYPFVTIGTPPQDYKHQGVETRVEIANGNTFRENVTVHAGTVGGGGVTRIGSQNYFMTSSHVGHDSFVGDHNTFVNYVSLGGHVEIGSYVLLSGYVGVVQRCRIGSYAMVGAGCIVSKDCPPFLRGKAKNNGRFAVQAVNKIGLLRKGFTTDTVERLDQTFRFFFLRDLTVAEAASRARDLFPNDDHVEALVRFIENSHEGVAR